MLSKTQRDAIVWRVAPKLRGRAPRRVVLERLFDLGYLGRDMLPTVRGWEAVEEFDAMKGSAGRLSGQAGGDVRTVVVRTRQLSGNRYGGRFTIAAAVGTSRGRRLRFVPERDLGTVEGAGTREEIARFSVSLADEAMRRYHADVALVDVAGDIRRLGAEGRSSGRSRSRTAARRGARRT